MIVRRVFRPSFGFCFRPYQLSFALYQTTNGLGLLTWFDIGLTWNEFYYHLSFIILGYGVNIGIPRNEV